MIPADSSGRIQSGPGARPLLLGHLVFSRSLPFLVLLGFLVCGAVHALRLQYQTLKEAWMDTLAAVVVTVGKVEASRPGPFQISIMVTADPVKVLFGEVGTGTFVCTYTQSLPHETDGKQISPVVSGSGLELDLVAGKKVILLIGRGGSLLRAEPFSNLGCVMALVPKPPPHGRKVSQGPVKISLEEPTKTVRSLEIAIHGRNWPLAGQCLSEEIRALNGEILASETFYLAKTWTATPTGILGLLVKKVFIISGVAALVSVKKSESVVLVRISYRPPLREECRATEVELTRDSQGRWLISRLYGRKTPDLGGKEER